MSNIISNGISTPFRPDWSATLLIIFRLGNPIRPDWSAALLIIFRNMRSALAQAEQNENLSLFCIKIIKIIPGCLL